AGIRSPFTPPTELDATEKDEPKKDGVKKNDKTEPGQVPAVKIDLEGIANRLIPVPVPAGNYKGLKVSDKALFWLSFSAGEQKLGTVQAVAIDHEDPEVKTVADKVTTFELSANGKKLLLVREKELLVVDGTTDKPDPKKSQVDLSGWAFAVDPREEWRQMFAE